MARRKIKGSFSQRMSSEFDDPPVREESMPLLINGNSVEVQIDHKALHDEDIFQKPQKDAHPNSRPDYVLVYRLLSAEEIGLWAL